MRNVAVVMAMLGGLSSVPAHASAAAEGRWSTHGPNGATVPSLAIDPDSPSVVYAATLGGVFRSADSGATWKRASKGLGNGSAATLVVVSPSSPATLYAVAGLGSYARVYRSSDGAASWRLADEGLKGEISSVGFDPSDAAVAYVTTIGGRGAVFKTTNGGQSWARSSDGIPGGWDSLAVVVSPAAPSTVYEAGTGGIFESTNAGKSWHPIFSRTDIGSLAISPVAPSGLFAVSYNGQVFVSDDGGKRWRPSVQLGYGAKVFVDPTSADTAYVARSRLYKTTDGGLTWTALPGPLEPVAAVAVDPSTPSRVYVGSGEDELPPFGGAGDGLYVSTDGGSEWPPSGSGLKATFELAVATAPSNPGVVYAGGASGLARSTNDGRTWKDADATLPPDAFVHAITVDPTDPDVVYVAIRGRGIWKSTDGGTSWTAKLPTLARDTIIPGIVIDPSAPNTIYAAGSTRLLKSTDGGDSWQSDNLPYPVDVIAIDPTNPQTLYVEADVDQEYALLKTTDGGGSWSQTGMSTGFAVRSLAVDASGTPYASGRQAGAGGDDVRISTDGGAHWSNRDTGLPRIPQFQAFSLAMDLVHPGTVYVGSFIGVYATTDGGQAWSPLNDGLRLRYVLAVAVDADGLAVHAATGGAGVFDRAA